MPNINLGEKFAAFGFDTYEIDGHDMKQIVDTLDRIRMRKNGKPKCIFANTVKGKGVSFMESSVDGTVLRLTMSSMSRQ